MEIYTINIFIYVIWDEAWYFFYFYLFISVLVVNFNKSKAIPDVHQDDLLVSYIHSYAPVNEVGFRYDVYHLY